MMRALTWHGTNDVRVDTVSDPEIINPRDAIIKITSTAICGSDLHLYDGVIPGVAPGDVLGHEFMGEVVETGSASDLKKGQRVVVPFTISCGGCPALQQQHSACDNSNPAEKQDMSATLYGQPMAALTGYSHLTGGYSGGQAEYARGLSDVGLIVVPDHFEDDNVPLDIFDPLDGGGKRHPARRYRRGVGLRPGRIVRDPVGHRDGRIQGNRDRPLSEPPGAGEAAGRGDHRLPRDRCARGPDGNVRRDRRGCGDRRGRHGIARLRDRQHVRRREAEGRHGRRPRERAEASNSRGPVRRQGLDPGRSWRDDRQVAARGDDGEGPAGPRRPDPCPEIYQAAAREDRGWHARYHVPDQPPLAARTGSRGLQEFQGAAE